MPTWGEILKEHIDYNKRTNKPPFDYVRRKYLKLLSDHTENPTILYATSWTQSQNIPQQLVSITDEDIQGFMEVTSNLTGSNLDLIIHNPGGSAEATEALVYFLRKKFNFIRVIIPYAAMSAATMLACCANEIVMGSHSFIGPIDPQMILPSRFGMQAIPAYSIIEQFQRAKKECTQNPKNLSVWLPIIEQYGPALLVQCEHAIDLSKTLVIKWLKEYMFDSDKDAEIKSKKIAKILSDHANFKSHGRHISRDDAISFGLKIVNLEDDSELQDLVLSVFHSTTQTFDGSPTAKIIENNKGKAFIKRYQQIPVQLPIQKVVPKKKETPKPKKKAPIQKK